MASFKFGNTRMVNTHGLSAAEIDDNDAASIRQQQWNQHAAAQAEAMRQGKIVTSQTVDDAETKHEMSRVALAKTLGYDPKQAPPMHVMLNKFITLPKEVQAGIIKAGGAQFLDPEEGEKILSDLTKSHDSSMQGFKNDVGKKIANGDVQFDENHQPFEWKDDPTLPAGVKKIKVPFNGPQLDAYHAGIKDGSIPDSFGQATTAAAVAPARPPTTDEFQQILNARAATGAAIPAVPTPQGTIPTAPFQTTEQFQKVLDARANSNLVYDKFHTADQNFLNSISSSSPTSTSATSVALPPTTPADVATRLGANVRDINTKTVNAITDPSNLEAAGSAIWDTAADIGNAPIQLSNMVGRVVGGYTGSPQGQLPLIPKISNQPPINPASDKAVADLSYLW